MEKPPVFNSVDDECRYWKERAKLYHKEWTDVKQEFDEFVEDSRQLETEMETTLEQKENLIKELRKQIIQLENDNESLKIRADSHNVEFSKVEKELEAVRVERDSMRNYVRQIEQENDDLERKHRILVESLSGFEQMLDKAYEKNAILEMEVDEKEVLQEKIQRLMDETRDLKQELNVKSRPTNLNNMNGLLDHSTNCIETQQQTSNTTPLANDYGQNSFKNPDNILNGNPAMTASSRTTALNIVADMLRKLNLDKTLLCSRCNKFRCICERPLRQNADFSASTSSMTSTTCPSLIDNNLNKSSSNLFQRFSQKLSSFSTDNLANNTMEAKLKTCREQVPTPRQ